MDIQPHMERGRVGRKHTFFKDFGDDVFETQPVTVCEASKIWVFETLTR